MVLFALHHTLPEQAERFRRTRDPARPDSLCLFRVNLPDDGLWHRLTFGVDDATAPGYLFVENVAHATRPLDL